MAIQLQGNGGVVADVSTDARAVRIEARAIDTQSRGAYSVGLATGIIAAALGANSEIMQFRWADSTRLAIIRRIRIAACVSTTMFAAGVPLQLDLIRSSSWSVAGTSGTAVSPAALLKRRASMQSSLVAAGDMRIATTGALGAGTKTLETLALASIVAAGPITGSLNGQIIPAGTVMWQADVGDGDHPLVLAANEGFSIVSVAVPGTGTWTAAVSVDWVEAASY